MTKEEIRAKYARIPTDFSQIEMLKNQLLDAGLLEVAQINPENAGKAIVFDENGALTVGEGGGTVSLDGNSLVIPEQEGPEPIITIDGVNYYHKQEFNLEEMVLEDRVAYDILTGERIEESYPCLWAQAYGPGGVPIAVGMRVFGTTFIWLFSNGNQYTPVSYTSRAFTVVDTQEEVTNITKICLPTCSAYYGFLSEDGKTFISYYNLKGEDVPEFVDSIKQGNAVISMKDARLPTAETVDAGKVLKVANAGGYELGNGWTKLYRHKLKMNQETQGWSVDLILTTNTDLHEVTSLITYDTISSSYFSDDGTVAGLITQAYYYPATARPYIAVVYRLFTDMTNEVTLQFVCDDDSWTDTITEL